MPTTDPRRPEPVTKAGLIAGTVAGLIITVGGLARALGWVTDDLDVNAVARQASDLILGAGVLWSTMAPFMLALWARERVTPLADPRDFDGTPLVVEPWPVDDDVDVPVVDQLVTEQMPAALPPVPRSEPTPIEAETTAALTATQPSMLAVRG